jgi:hypothetical protein
MSTARAYSVKLGATAVSAPSGRLYGVKLAGVASVTIDPIPSQVVEPEAAVSLTAVVVSPEVPTFTWRVISGGGTIIGTESTVTLIAPSGSPQQVYPPLTKDVLVGVTAHIEGSSSVERVVTVHVLPQLRWFWNGTDFIGAKPYRYS